MSDDFPKTIYNTLKLKETEELLEIWKTNDRVEWLGITFEVIQEILKLRQVDLPPQNEPVFMHSKNIVKETHNQIAPDDENEGPGNFPVFYQPKENLRIVKWLDLAARISIAINIIIDIPEFSRLHSIISSYFLMTHFPDWAVVSITWSATLVTGGLGLGMQSYIVYFSLKGLASILRILMEMEFNSRTVI